MPRKRRGIAIRQLAVRCSRQRKAKARDGNAESEKGRTIGRSRISTWEGVFRSWDLLIYWWWPVLESASSFATGSDLGAVFDLDGSTLDLVNAANVDPGPVTTYTYHPSGNPSFTGVANDWPFQFQGMEKEYTDPGTYYYSGGGQFYSPQLVRSLSETSATSTSGTGGGPAGNSIGTQSVGGGPDVGRNAAIGTAAGAPFGGLAVLSIIWGSDALTAGLATPAAIVGTIVDGLVQLFLDLFGGSSSPPTQATVAPWPPSAVSVDSWNSGRPHPYGRIIRVRTALARAGFPIDPTHAEFVSGFPRVSCKRNYSSRLLNPRGGY